MRFPLRLVVVLAIVYAGILLPVPGRGTSVAARPKLQLASSSIELPTVMAVDPHGDVYVAVYGQCGLYDSIVKLAPDGSVLRRLEFTYGSKPGKFKAITGLAVDATGNIYVADFLNNRVQKLSPAGTPLAVWNGRRDGGPGLSHPQGLALDAQGDVYVVDSNASRVVKLAPDGTVLAALSTGYTSAAGAGFPSDLLGALESIVTIGDLVSAFVAGVAVDPAGTVFVATGDDLRTLSPTGAPLAVWKPPAGKGYRQQPRQVALDAAGNIYTSGGATSLHQQSGGGFAVVGVQITAGAGSIDKLSPSGKLLARWAKSGKAPGRFGGPAGLALDPAGNLYVADVGNNRIQKLSSTGTPLAIWGDVRTTPSPPGRFGRFIDQLAAGTSGRIFAATLEPDRIDQISPAGRIISTWSPGELGASSSGTGLTIDRAGHVYLADSQDTGVVEFNRDRRLLHRWTLPRQHDKAFGITITPHVDDIAIAASGRIYVAADQSLWSMQRASGHWKKLVRGSSSTTARHAIGRLAIDAQGTIYAIDRQRVDVFSPGGKQRGQRVAKEACAGVSFAPAAVAVGPRGILYVADGDPVDQVVSFSPSGRLLARWGSRGDGPRQFRFSFEAALTVDRQGTVFVGDTSGRIRAFSSSGRLLSIWR